MLQKFGFGEGVAVNDPLQPFAPEETGRWHASSLGRTAFSAFPHGITQLLGVGEVGAREASRASTVAATGC